MSCWESKITELPIWTTLDDRDYYKTIDRIHGDSTPTPMDIRAADGSIKHCKVSVQIVPFQNEPCFMTIFSDVTEEMIQ